MTQPEPDDIARDDRDRAIVMFVIRYCREQMKRFAVPVGCSNDCPRRTKSVTASAVRGAAIPMHAASR
jgi:hypothetical protein